MRFQEPLLEGRLVERYKRFLADIVLSTGEQVTAHCANPGAMMGLKEPGSRVYLSRARNPARKLKYDWEFIEVPAGGGPHQLVGINTSRPNLLVAEALRDNRLAPFTGYDRIRPEVKYGRNSRVDFLLEKDGAPPCYLEVKNCHLMREAGFAEFPDCVAARSAKHLYELADMVAAGARAALVYVIQMEAERFDVARDIDPAYDRAFRHALAAGVESYAYICRITTEEVVIDRPVPIVTPL
ncbi:DNA/RNA nuclease SfsA [Microvirga subterranea]|uniref:Sugar fermentation stimulation protein homolog n=1 Tax=Microvirga subterranea TaxID=186651 RepID=A0A370HQW8_9HYPH|nr:DNA/RNA nuclease SfsA [Microvirga subterranea]RDI60936.1 sugar fermentation stimulation protein A [Microvirga subterranea]